jgi:SAM-dependent methyltransferase
VVDHQFADAGLAALYDRFCPWDDRGDFDFYLPLVMAAGSVLDVGCGTGALLHGARARGHGGRLCGLDPGEGMLRLARRRSDIEWIHGDLASLARDEWFDLVVMTGHAFQVLTGDDEMREALITICSVLGDQGRFAFETRHPLARAWEEWTPDRAVEAEGPGGAVVRMAHQVETPVHGDLVSFTTTFTCPDWGQPQVSRSTLRFLDPPSLSSLLADAGLAIDEQFGDWDASPLTEHSPEIITITSRDKVEA